MQVTRVTGPRDRVEALSRCQYKNQDGNKFDDIKIELNLMNKMDAPDGFKIISENYCAQVPRNPNPQLT